MKIFILCDLFPPAFGPRMGYLCKYMKRAGWEPVVLTEYIDDQTFAFLTGNADVHYVKFFHATGRVTRKLEWILILLLDFLFRYKERKMLKAASSLLCKGGYAGILCSTYRTFPLPTAIRAARKFDLPVIADLRDIIEQYPSNEFIAHPLRSFPWLDRQMVQLFRKRLVKDRNQALAHADYVTTVSPWHVQQLQPYNPNVKLIYNGFDPELFYPEQIKTDQFIITYTGRLLSTAMRDPSLLLEALRMLSAEKFFTEENCRVHWYVDEESRETIRKEAEKYEVLPYMDFKAYVPASEVPAILNRSAVLLQLTNRATDSGPKGLMTTKIFESLAVEKPILCVRSDESYLEQTLRESKAGVAARHVEEVCHFLKECFIEWKEKGYTTSHTNKSVVRNFSRQEQAKQFMSLFETISPR